MCCNDMWLAPDCLSQNDGVMSGVGTHRHDSVRISMASFFTAVAVGAFNRSAHEIVPLAPKGLLDPFHRCDQHIFLPRFDLLQGT